MAGFTSPNHTQTPNDLFDSLMRDMTDAELRVVLVAIRKTLGWHKTREEISLSQFERLTGLSRQGVIDGLERAIVHGFIREAGTGKRGVKIYELVISDDQSSTLTSQASRPELVKPVDQSPASTSQASRHTKEKSLKQTGKEKTIAPDGARANGKPQKPSAFNDMKEAIRLAFGWQTPTPNEWAKIQKAASQLIKVEYPASDVSALYAECKRRFDNFSPLALTGVVSDVRARKAQSSYIPAIHIELKDGDDDTP